MQDQHTRLHERAMHVAHIHKKSEVELISILQEIDATRAYLHFDARSLYDYCERILKLSEGTSYNLITVARRAIEVPALKKAIELGEVSLSKARRIAPVLTRENQNEWIELAATKTSREIERAVASESPQAAAIERVEYIAEDLLRARLDISEALMKKLRRIQDLESQRTAKAVSLVEALEAMAASYIEKHDPLEKAKRAQTRAKLRVELKREARAERNRESYEVAVSAQARTAPAAKWTPSAKQESFDVPADTQSNQLGTCRVARRAAIPAAVRHAVRLRDLGQCTYEDSGGRCPATRWTEQHHIVPVSEGGSNQLENITTLCSIHHRHVHGHVRLCEPTEAYVA